MGSFKFAAGLRIMIVLLLIFLLIAAVLIARGFFDPRPIGHLQKETAVPSLPLSDSAAGWRQKPVFAQLSLPSSFSVKLTARWGHGEKDLLGGLLISAEDGRGILIGVSPLGELAVWQPFDANIAPQAQLAAFPRQPWPHILRDSAANEIWVDVSAMETAVRINGELAWRGDPLIAPLQLFVWGQSFGEAAEMEFPRIRLYAPVPP